MDAVGAWWGDGGDVGGFFAWPAHGVVECACGAAVVECDGALCPVVDAAVGVTAGEDVGDASDDVDGVLGERVDHAGGQHVPNVVRCFLGIIRRDDVAVRQGRGFDAEVGQMRNVRFGGVGDTNVSRGKVLGGDANVR